MPLSPIFSPAIAPAVHAFSTREGGVSAGAFASLNFGNPGDLPVLERDPAANIAANFSLLLGAIGAAGREIVEVHQVHGAFVHVVARHQPTHDFARTDGHDTKADAIVTDDPSRLLCVRVADCVPVLLSGDDGRVVAAVHAGWRGVVLGVASAAVRAMIETFGARSISAAIGPCIGKGAFEVGPEVLEEFRRVFGSATSVARDGAGGKGWVDLQAALREQLNAEGVGRIDVVAQCTASEPARFFSHRRERGHTGRMVGVIGAVAGPVAR